MGNNYTKVTVCYCCKIYNPYRLIIYTTKNDRFVLYCNNMEELNKFNRKLTNKCIIQFGYNRAKHIKTNIVINGHHYVIPAVKYKKDTYQSFDNYLELSYNN